MQLQEFTVLPAIKTQSTIMENIRATIEYLHFMQCHPFIA